MVITLKYFILTFSLYSFTTAEIANYEFTNLDYFTKPDPRIVNGHEATPHSIPYQAFIIARNTTSGWYCTGVLISENYIIAAAHSLYLATSADIRLGVHNFRNDESSQVQLTSKEFLIHENYIFPTTSYNIAIITFPASIHFTPAIQSIFLSGDTNNDYTNALATVSGWGSNIHGGPVSDVLNFIQVKIISNDECKNYYSDIDTSMLCTSGSGYVAICNSDNGGPLVTDGVLVGITSFALSNCDTEKPSGFTRITTVLEWLLAHTDAKIG